MASESTAFFPNSFKSRQHSAIVILIALHRTATLLVAVGPSQPDEMFL